MTESARTLASYGARSETCIFKPLHGNRNRASRRGVRDILWNHWLSGTWQLAPAIDYPHLGGFVRYDSVNRILEVLDEETLRRTRILQDTKRSEDTKTRWTTTPSPCLSSEG